VTKEPISSYEVAVMQRKERRLAKVMVCPSVRARPVFGPQYLIDDEFD
jgi:hypothetical protein